MRRNPVYTFQGLNSQGIYNVPLESTVQINDADSAGNSLVVQITSKNGLNPYSTIGDFLNDETLYEKPGQLGTIQEDQKGQPNGVAPLNSEAKISPEYLTAFQINNVYVEQTQADMLMLQVGVGDVCIVIDDNKTYINLGTATGTISDWAVLRTDGGLVNSVNSKTGTVMLNTDDITPGLVNKYLTQSNFDPLFSQKNIEDLLNVQASTPGTGELLVYNGTGWENRPMPISVQSVNGFTGDVVLETNNITESVGGNKYYQDVYVDARIQITIDDTAGIGAHNNLWSADKLATDYAEVTQAIRDNSDGINTLASDITSEIDSRFTGKVVISDYTDGDPANDVLGVIVFDDDTTRPVVANNRGYYRFDQTTSKNTGMRFETFDNGGVQEDTIRFKLNDVTSLKLDEGKAPTTQFAPTAINSLTRKDYVDSEVLNVQVAADNATNLAQAAQTTADSKVASVQAGFLCDVDITDPLNPIVNVQDMRFDDTQIRDDLTSLDTRVTNAESDIVDVQTTKQDDLGFGTAGQILATNATVDGTEWIDLPAPKGGTTNNRPVDPALYTTYWDEEINTGAGGLVTCTDNTTGANVWKTTDGNIV